MTKQMQGHAVLVTGGTGNVGWGVAHAVREAGGRVLLPTRSSDGATALEDEFGTGHARVIEADVGSADGLDLIESVIEEVGGLHHVVAPIGAWWQKGDTLAQPASELEALLDTYITTQLRLLRRVAPHLSDTNGSYTLVTGTAGEGLPDGAGLLVVAVRGQYALAEVLREELAEAAFRFNEFRIGARIEREPRSGVIPSREAGRAFLDVMTGEAKSSLIRYPT